MKNFRRVNWCQAPDSGARFASISIRIATSTGAWHRARGRDLPAFRSGIAKVPGTGRGGEICQHSDPGWQRCLAPGAGTRFASISIGDRKGAWHRARGRDLPAFRSGMAKVPGTGRGGEICQHFDWGSQRCPANGTDFNDFIPVPGT